MGLESAWDGAPCPHGTSRGSLLSLVPTRSNPFTFTCLHAEFYHLHPQVSDSVRERKLNPTATACSPRARASPKGKVSCNCLFQASLSSAPPPPPLTVPSRSQRPTPAAAPPMCCRQPRAFIMLRICVRMSSRRCILRRQVRRHAADAGGTTTTALPRGAKPS